MRLYKQQNTALDPIKEKGFKLEKDLQKITEDNLSNIFGLEFVTTEFQLNQLRIDTLAYDDESKSFVIIEYKRDRSFSVVDQGFAYLALMLNNKADFILEYNEKMKGNLKRDDVDWTQSRVLFIAHGFTNHQKEAINFKDLPIELWEVRKYENDLVSFNPIKAIKTAESINTLSKDENVKKITQQVKTLTVDDHIKEDWDSSRELYETLREKLFGLDERFEEVSRRHYISYKIGTTSIIQMKIRKSKIRLELTRTQLKDIKDPEKKVSYIEKSFEHWNQHMSYMDIVTDQDVDYAMFLIKQLMERFTKEKIIN
jgi:predicted transport protein